MTSKTIIDRQRPAHAPQKMARLRIMIDKESLSTAPNAAFISLSAVVMNFDAKTHQESLLNRFNMYVDIQSAFEYANLYGGHIDPDTIMWWFRQCDAARMDQADGQEEAQPLETVLRVFDTWVRDMALLYGLHTDRVELWSCGPMQDQNWLENAYRNMAPTTKTTWGFWGVRCGRSFLSTYYKVKEGVANEGTLHVGIDDCCNQARKLFAIIRSIDLADPDLRNVRRNADGTWHDLDDMSPLNQVNVHKDDIVPVNLFETKTDNLDRSAAAINQARLYREQQENKQG